MARGQIVVETSQLDSAAGRVEDLANTYNTTSTPLFSTVQARQSSWSGTANPAFTNQIEGFRDDFQRMEQLMRDYAAYLRKTATTYRDTQNSIAQSAKSLSQGS